jgi:peptidoglycan/xylan/chitin deacetylase (PgdA/CDA1 family)
LWHRQHYSLPGQVATASMLVTDDRLFTAVHHSDLVQRISRRRDLKTRVEARFRGWDRMLLNSILGFAVEQRLTTVHVPTAAAARADTDPARSVQTELFDRVYDRHVRDSYRVRPTSRWWALDIEANRNRIVSGETRIETTSRTKTICICHDIERGLGHRQAEPDFVTVADACADATLDRALAAEAENGVTATYNVVGTVLAAVRDPIASGGHCFGFHTFDHYVDRRLERPRAALARRSPIGRVPDGQPRSMQLSRCRDLDFRIKGYRPAQSRLGADTDTALLARHNFEWLASSSHSLDLAEPRLERGIVKIPIRYDDFPLHRGMTYDVWEARVASLAREHDFFAVSFHDCYGPSWVDGYDRLLERLADLGTIKTFDEVAAEVVLADAG